jgi:hypothetical protein
MFAVFKDSRQRYSGIKTHNSQIVELYYKHVTEKNR